MTANNEALLTVIVIGAPLLAALPLALKTASSSQRLETATTSNGNSSASASPADSPFARIKEML